jgi:thiol-disulfide isomerase/thioredoxin
MKIKRSIFTFLLLMILVLTIGCEKKEPVDIGELEFKQFLEKKYFEVTENSDYLPDFDYQLISGQKESLKSNKGNIILLNFWATWCYPCKQEMPDLEELKHQMKGEKFRILTVNSGDKIVKIQSFLNKYPYSFDVIIDENRAISSSLNIVGLPTTFILDHDLRVIGKIMGPINWKDKTFVEYLTRFSRT